jgi:N6-adenosine-specific RNA methylase IME4
VTWPFGELERGAYTVVLIDPPWRWAGGTKGRPQHYARMTLDQIKALPVRQLLKPEGGRVCLWLTAPLMHRMHEIRKAWRLRYSSMIPWIKLWNGEDGMFVYANSVARGTGLEVMGNAEYCVILKAGRPHSILGNPFPGVLIEPRREHSRKPVRLHVEIEQRIPGPYCEIFARQPRAGWSSWGNETGKFAEAAE